MTDNAHDAKVEINPAAPAQDAPYVNIIGFLEEAAAAMNRGSGRSVATALTEVVSQCKLDPDFGGYGLRQDVDLTGQQETDVVFLCSAYLEALKAEARARSAPCPLRSRPAGRRGMTMAEKIFTSHDTTRSGWVRAGDVVQVDVDWVLASELSHAWIERSYDALGRPGIFRNDRYWLAGDHRVEPALYDNPDVKALMQTSQKAQQEFKMTDFQGFNYTIMHTEFVRERAQPGMLCIGADSHTCSAGAVSCLAIGLGATDVCMPLITGQTWFSIPETISIRFINALPPGLGGKDTILYILKEFKRNTIAADRVVEFSGPGLKFLSCDARFAIANMCTEFGAVTGIFEADEQTFNFVNHRAQKKHKSSSIYFKPDEDAEYVERHTIDLSKVESFIAVHPSPDNVVPVSDVTGTKLDGCFIGACTTAEEDLLFGAYVLEAGLQRGLRPVGHGRRVVVPGSRPIQHKLEKLGFLDIYRRAGFKVGVPGCSMCVGQGTDQAHAGETWLSSQNRNFKNRMGAGSIANLASAATVAASSFSMEISDPRELLELVDLDALKAVLGRRAIDGMTRTASAAEKIQYVEPFGKDGTFEQGHSAADSSKESLKEHLSAPGTMVQKKVSNPAAPPSSPKPETRIVTGKALVMGDFINTDAIIASKFLMTSRTEEELGSHCMEFFMPEFRGMVRDDGLDIVVGGAGFGCGSSRDPAVQALKGIGVKAVIAKSFGFIYARNQPNLGLVGITITDEAFYQTAQMGADLTIDLDAGQVVCAGGRRFPFVLSDMEKRLIAAGGLTEAFKSFGKTVFDHLCRPLKDRDINGGTTKDMEDVEF